MHLLRCCILILPLWLAWIAGLGLYQYYGNINIYPTPWPFLISLGLLFPLPVFGLWFYAGAASVQNLRSRIITAEIILTSLGASAILVLLTLIPISLGFVPKVPYQQIFSQYWPLTGFLWALYTIVLLIFKVVHLKEDMEEMRRQQTNLEQAVRDTELEYLRSQLNPHFLFNALNSLATLTLTQPQKAHSMILELSDYLRSGILRPSKGLITLEKELEACMLYLNIEKMRFGERLQHQVQVSDEAMQRLLPQTLLQPIYENAIKYGVSENAGTTVLTTQASIVEDLLVITISNPLPSFVPEKKGKGLGLRNIRQRLEILYQRRDLLEILKDDSTFTVILKIPWQTAL